MASILTPVTDLDDLLTSWTDNGNGTYDSSEINIDAINKTFTFKVGGNLAAAGSGVTGQALYSLFKDRWKNVASITKYDFPMLSITNEQFEFINGWKPADDTTRKTIRTAGWAEVEADGNASRQYAGIVSLGSLGLTDQPYFAQDASVTASTTNTTYTGPINEAVQVFGTTSHGDVSAGNFDSRSYFKVYVRERGKIYADSDLTAIGVTTMTYIVYRFPLANSDDLKLETSADTELATGGSGTPDTSPYSQIDIEYLVGNILGTVSDTTYSINDVVQENNGAGSRWFICTGAGTVANTSATAQGAWTGTATWSAFAGEREVESGQYSAYNVIIDANNLAASPGGDKENVYDFAQYMLRQSGTIDTGASRNGNVADLLVEFIGDTLHTAPGVFVDDIAAADTNNIVFHDYIDGTHTYPLTVTVTINFNSNLSTDADAVFYAYYKNVPSGNYGDTDAIQVVKADLTNVGADVTNNVPDGASGSTYAFNYAYDGDTTGGRTVSSDTDIVVVAVGLGTGQYVKAEGTITNTGASVSLVAPLERNFSNPV